MQAKQVRDMAVVHILLFEILEPFLEPATRADLRRVKPCVSSLEFVRKIRLDAEDLRRFQAVSKEVPDYRHVHRSIFFLIIWRPPRCNLFPYTIRLVSEILSSNGSTSM